MKEPLIMAHAGGMDHGRENSLEAVKESIKYKPDIIELDIRRSKDNILFCYHGFGIFIYFMAYFLRFFNFATIKKLIKVDDLEQILAIIPHEIIIYLNLKDYKINGETLESMRIKYPHTEYWIGTSYSYQAANIQKDFHKTFSFHATWPNIFGFKFALNRAVKNDLASVRLLPWQCTTKNINLIKKYGLNHSIEPAFISNQRYSILRKKYGTLYNCVNDLRKPNDVTSIYKHI